MDRVELGDSSQERTPKRGWSKWIESGMWYSAPKLSPKKFGPHAYAIDHAYSKHGIRDCPCGCFMLSSSSGGPVDPFGPCPENPKTRKRALQGAGKE